MILRYLRDRIVYICAWIICALGCWAYLSGLNVAPDGALFVAIIIILAGAVPLIVDAVRRLVWYRKTQSQLEEMDRPYLLYAVMEEPGFMDGQLLHDWLGEVSLAMNEQIAQREQAVTDYRQYLEMWVHEIKTPIATALLTAENHPSKEMRSIQDDLQRIESYVMQVLYYARSSSLQDDYIITECTLESLVDAALKRNARLLIRSGFSIEKGDLDAIVYTDGKWIGFVLDQIIQNSVKYRRGDKGILRFAQEKSKEHVELLVEDTGVGVPEQDLPRLFQKGFTGENGRQFTKATGMGLYIARNLLEKMSLTIHAEHGKDGGLLVRIRFPRDSMLIFTA